MTSTYTKPFLTVGQQIDRLIAHGLQIDSRQKADRELRRIGYYRLSGYWYPFRQQAASESARRPSVFVPGTSLEVVLEVYAFDETLRTALLTAISRVEVGLRFRIGHLLGRHGPFAHCDPANLDPKWSAQQARSCSSPSCSHCAWMSSDHDSWLERQLATESVSKEAFTAHIHDNYGKPLPVWVATEVMSFGALNRLLNGMTQSDRQQLAADFDIIDAHGNGDASVLINWVEHLRQVRNACAHHARVWNKNFDATLSVPRGVPEIAHLNSAREGAKGPTIPSSAVRHIYGTLVILNFLLARIVDDRTCQDSIRVEIERFTAEKPTRLKAMGFPAGWPAEDIWQEQYARDAVRGHHAELMRTVPMLNTQDASELLTSVAEKSKRRSRLTYYRKNGALLSVPWTESHSYPAFQVDEASGDIPPVVVTANRRLLAGNQGTESQRWSALEWWLEPKKELNQAAPADSLQNGTLTVEVLDKLLHPRHDE